MCESTSLTPGPASLRHEGDPRLIKLTDGTPADADAIASLLAELDGHFLATSQTGGGGS
jgi:hypothetical protein